MYSDRILQKEERSNENHPALLNQEKRIRNPLDRSVCYDRWHSTESKVNHFCGRLRCESHQSEAISSYVLLHSLYSHNVTDSGILACRLDQYICQETRSGCLHHVLYSIDNWAEGKIWFFDASKYARKT